MTQETLFPAKPRPEWLDRHKRANPQPGDVVAGWRVLQRSPYGVGLLIQVCLDGEPDNAGWVSEWSWVLNVLEAEGVVGALGRVNACLLAGEDWRDLL